MINSTALRFCSGVTLM